jgi:hypothetical protein
MPWSKVSRCEIPPGQKMLIQWRAQRCAVPAGYPSSQHLLDHVPVHVGEPALDPVVVEREPGVIEAEEVEDRGVEIVDGRHLLHGLVAELVGRPVVEDPLDTRPGQPDGEAGGNPSPVFVPVLMRELENSPRGVSEGGA